MYSAFWLWAIAQALLGLPVSRAFGILFFGCVGKEERMMLETFGDSYRVYAERTGRIFPSIC